MSALVIICDVPDHYLENQVFTEGVQKNSFGEGFWVVLKEMAEKRDWEMVTADIFLNQREKYTNHKAYLISYMSTKRTAALLKSNVIPLVVYSLESPNVAIKFYSSIKPITSTYKYSVLFGGVAESLKKPEKNLTLYWPNTIQRIRSEIPWGQRQFLCMIASNKSRYDIDPNKRFSLLLKWRKKMGLLLMRIKAPFTEVIDLYSTRFKAIEYFSASSNFFLFGAKWDEKKNLTKALADQIEKLAPKPVAFRDKMDTLSRFKFCICFENCSHPGYLTEKIFDCFFAGTIPIYFGAPDIEKFIPKDCFIDFRDFNDFRTLDMYLADLTIEKAEGFLRSTEAFISSSQFLKFTDTYLAKQIFNSITKETKNS